MAVKGPPPSVVPRAPVPRKPAKTTKSGSGAASKAGGAKGGRRGTARGAPPAAGANPGSVGGLDPDEAAAYERHHAAELEEEGRRHLSTDADGELQRSRAELEEEEQRIQGLNFDDERKKRGRRQQDEEDEDDGEEAAERGQAAAARGFAVADGRGRYFENHPADRMGDDALRDPNEMKRVLGPSVRFAQHAMLLAEKRFENGASRAEAIAYLAELYLGVGDRGYANKALREFGPATGIINLYPLEVMKHLLEHVPGFFTKVQRGSFLTRPKHAPDSELYELEAGVETRLHFDPGLRIRGFAIEGGECPGYLLEPGEEPGSYLLTLQTPGEYRVLLSAIRKDGSVLIEELRCSVAAGDDQAQRESQAMERERREEWESVDDAEGSESGVKKKREQDLTIHFKKRI